MGDAGAWLQGDRFDATMNYTFRSIALRFFARDEIDGLELLDESARMIAQHPWPVTLVNHNLIGSHDTPRFRTEAGGDERRLWLATVFQLTFPGAPGIYYGDEIGLHGGEDPECRGAFPWEPNPLDNPINQAVAALIGVRRTRASLLHGRWVPRHGRGDVVSFDRVHGGEATTVVINRGAQAAEVRVPASSQIRWGEGTVVDSVLSIPSRSAAILWD
jgi:glycosidase